MFGILKVIFGDGTLIPATLPYDFFCYNPFARVKEKVESVATQFKSIIKCLFIIYATVINLMQLPHILVHQAGANDLR